MTRKPLDVSKPVLERLARQVMADTEAWLDGMGVTAPTLSDQADVVSAILGEVLANTAPYDRAELIAECEAVLHGRTIPAMPTGRTTIPARTTTGPGTVGHGTWRGIPADPHGRQAEPMPDRFVSPTAIGRARVENCDGPYWDVLARIREQVTGNPKVLAELQDLWRKLARARDDARQAIHQGRATALHRADLARDKWLQRLRAVIAREDRAARGDRRTRAVVEAGGYFTSGGSYVMPDKPRRHR